MLALGRRDDPEHLVGATLEAARLHGLDVEHLDAAEIRRRFPAVRVEDGWEGAFEREAGFVDPEAAVRAHTRLALREGADLRAETVTDVDLREPAVRTDRARYRARSVVVTAGPWAPQLLADAGLPITARRKVLAHFEPLDPALLSAPTTPGYFISTARGMFYGFPDLPGQGVKIGRHDGGDDTTPETIDRRVRQEEVDELRGVLADFLPDAAGPVRETLTCMYTMSPDGDFLLGALPDTDRAFVATGCSGHAFKFVPALGEVLADLATGRAPAVEVGFLDPARFARASG